MTAPPPPDPGVFISSAQTHAEVRRVADGQIRMEGKLDRLLSDQAEQREANADHERRLRALETKVWMAMGVAVVLGAGSGAGIAQIMGR